MTSTCIAAVFSNVSLDSQQNKSPYRVTTPEVVLMAPSWRRTYVIELTGGELLRTPVSTSKHQALENQTNMRTVPSCMHNLTYQARMQP